MAISHMPHAWLIPPIRFTNQPDHTPNTLNLVFLLHCLFYSGLTFRRYEEKYMKLKVRETRELASILQCPHFSSIYSKLGWRKASNQTNSSKTSHMPADTYDQSSRSPFISCDWEEEKAAIFWTIMNKIESRNLARNIKCKGYENHKLEQDKGRKSQYLTDPHFFL